MRKLLDQVEDEAQFQRTSTMLDTLLLAGVVSTYLPTAKIAGYGDNQARNPNYHTHLGRTMDEDYAAGRPFRASAIINVKWGMPGEAYFERARQLGCPIPRRLERDFWDNQVRALGQDPLALSIV